MINQQNNSQKTVEIWMNRIRFFFCGLFFLVCCLPLLGAIAGIETPSLEKRTLANRPSLLTGGTLNMDYPSQFDAWFSDHFTFRTLFIARWHQLNRLLLQKSGNERVTVGKSGWLFFSDTLDDYLGVNQLDSVALERLDQLLHLQQKWLARRQLDWIFLVAPNKNTIYPQMMPEHLNPIRTTGNLDLLKAKLADNQFLDLEPLLISAAARADEPNYHRSDSHWNNAGARQASQALLDLASQAIPGLARLSENAPGRMVQDWTGDLAVMLDPAGPEPDWQFYYDDEIRYTYDRTPRSMEDILITTQSNTGSGTLLMFRDSFANALIPYLSGSFARAVYSRAVPLDYGLIEKEKPDLVVLQIVERNLPVLLEKPPRLPADRLPADEPVVKAVQAISPATDEQDSLLVLTDQDVSLEVSQSGSWLKISGLWLDTFLQASVDRVLIGLPPTAEQHQSEACASSELNQSGSRADNLNYFEASPVADGREMDWRHNGGFTLYLEPVHWQTGSQTLRLYLHAGTRWLQAELTVVLP